MATEREQVAAARRLFTRDCNCRDCRGEFWTLFRCAPALADALFGWLP